MDDLQTVLAHIRRLLEAGLTANGHGFRLPIMASVDREGKPSARALILRHVDFEAREVRLHTDSRTRKVEEIGAYPYVMLVFNDQVANVQVQLKGCASLHQDDVYAEDAWTGASRSSRRAYLTEAGPGSSIKDPASGLPADVAAIVPDEARLRQGRHHFTAIRIRFDEIEWLLLDGSENRRAAFRFEADSGWGGNWCVP